MRVVLASSDQFGPNGPKSGDIGQAFGFARDPEGDILFYVIFPGHIGYHVCPANIVVNDHEEVVKYAFRGYSD